MKRLALLLTLVLLPGCALAEGFDLNALLPSGWGAASVKIVQLLAVLTVLSIAPGLLIMVTSFTRFAIALSFLRSGLGLQSTPANLVLISLALFMTFYVMAPTFEAAWQDGLKPLMDQKITEVEAFEKISQPFRKFMIANVREKDIKLFDSLSREPRPAGDYDKLGLQVLAPAFMISELRRGFEIGFLIVLPFLVIDMIVAVVTMSMGMMMLPPTAISLPVKVLFFILIDGWNLLVGSLIRSYG
ncbi:flagellar type III secretion system pore protein FliP [Methylosinus sp. 3S-1]|uniref:flagellar type III secretion system pore protein FliP n=1 Tax=Methylosinus sp. 3S-1 TaxID=1849840 RepID=UPI0007EE6F40|nr:flagellar type III secretion system pore protein FliP [Methylosinus sp. 3S-1]OBS50438.1 flagellar biosynthetic protein FliP [Methylosinus sp. 3S-1]